MLEHYSHGTTRNDKLHHENTRKHTESKSTPSFNYGRFRVLPCDSAAKESTIYDSRCTALAFDSVVKEVVTSRQQVAPGPPVAAWCAAPF